MTPFKYPGRAKRKTRESGFSILEVSIAAVVVGGMFIALLSGLTSSFGHIQFGREELRATQILEEKLDTIRLYRWSQISPATIKTNFTESFLPTGSLDEPNARMSSGIVYNGTIMIEDSPVTEPYKSTLKKVTVAVSWKSGLRVVRSQMVTYISKNGLQKYLP